MNDVIARRLARAERRVELLEQMIEDKLRELYLIGRDMTQTNADLTSTLHVMPGALMIIDAEHHIVRVNRATSVLLDRDEDDLYACDVQCVWPTYTGDLAERRSEVEWLRRDGTAIPVLLSSTTHAQVSERPRVVCVGIDLRDRHRDELARRRESKLEALGQLAAGIAHEINTPMQFISDNLGVVREGSERAHPFVDSLLRVFAAAQVGEVPPALLDEAAAAGGESRWTYYGPKQRRALERAREGVERVSVLVGALKRFAHPSNDLGPVDINAALATAITVARPELRRVATVSTKFGALPTVEGHAGDLHQVFLNLLVNAAHAIADAGRGAGQIGIATEPVNDERIAIRISDTGCGIRPDIRDRIFDPFFTTKAPGRGTGQGLAIAHSVVVERHRGSIDLDTGPSGTTFIVQLPIRRAA